MILAFSLLPATLFVVMAYIVFYCTLRIEGGMKTFGQVLTVWLFILAIILPLSGAYLSISGYSPMQDHMRQMGEMMGESMGESMGNQE